MRTNEAPKQLPLEFDPDWSVSPEELREIEEAIEVMDLYLESTSTKESLNG